MTLNVTSWLSLGAFLLVTASFNAYGRCSGEMQRDPYSPCYTGWGTQESDTVFRLRSVIVSGSSSAAFDPYVGSQLWWADLGAMQYSSTVQAKSVFVSIGIIITPFVFPLLPKCAITTTLNPIKTPDQDDVGKWLIAKEAIMVAYGTNWNAVRAGQRVDVKYPSGDVVRFMLSSVTHSSQLNERTVNILRFLDGMPSGEKSPCV